MSKNTFKLGDKVKLVSLPDGGALEMGDKLRVTHIESGHEQYVRVERKDGLAWWLNHSHLELRGKKSLKVGDKVIVKAQPNPRFFPVGTEGVVTLLGGSKPYSYKVGALGDYWFYSREQLKRVKNKTPAAKPEITKPEMSWPWPAGTKVRLLPCAPAYNAENAGKFYTLWHDGSDVPPVVDGEKKLVCFVSEDMIELVE